MELSRFRRTAGAIVCGLCIAVQGRIGAAVTTSSGSALFAGLAMFMSSLFLVAAVTVAYRPVRTATAVAFRALWVRDTPRRLLLAGPIGAFVAVVQAGVIAVTGTSFYSVTFVLGQVAGGAALDAAGPANRERMPLRGRRLVSLGIAAASVAVSLAAIGVGGMATLAVPLLLVLVAGVLVTGQHLLNSRPTLLTGRAEPAALLTYLFGTVAMVLVTVLAWPIAAPKTVEPWFFLSGFLGPVAILLAATLISSLGAFALTLGIVTGQMSGALLLDLVWPSQLAVGVSSVAAAVLMVGAMVVAGRR